MVINLDERKLFYRIDHAPCTVQNFCSTRMLTHDLFGVANPLVIKFYSFIHSFRIELPALSRNMVSPSGEW